MQMCEPVAQRKILNVLVITETVRDNILILHLKSFPDFLLVKPDDNPFFCLLETDYVEIVNDFRWQ